MKEKLKDLFTRHREMITYIFFGGCTTLVSWVSYWLFAHPLGVGTTVSTVISNILGVLFAYVTNRIWVFRSETRGVWPVLKEMGAFFLSRLATILLDTGIMYVFVERLHGNDLVIKLASNVLIIILNYVLSKLLVFRAKKKDSRRES